MTDARALPFLPVEALDGRPHVVVDGAPRQGSVLTLSHWPGAPTPAELQRDLSTEIAVAHLASSEPRAIDAIAVTNDHLDVDGLCALYLLVDPKRALDHAATLVEIARVGDFGVVRDERAALIALALEQLMDEGRSPIAQSAGGRSWVAAAYVELLGCLPSLLEDPERARPYALESLARFEATRRDLASGRITIEERPALGLAIVRSPETTNPDERAVHSSTSAPRILELAGHRYRYRDRYETWVRYPSARLPRRRDLRPLASALSETERGTSRWIADPPGALLPELGLVDANESSLGPDEVVALVAHHLDAAPPAWEPDAAVPLLVGSLSEPGDPKAGTSGRDPSRWRGRRRGRPAT